MQWEGRNPKSEKPWLDTWENGEHRLTSDGANQAERHALPSRVHETGLPRTIEGHEQGSGRGRALGGSKGVLSV